MDAPRADARGITDLLPGDEIFSYSLVARNYAPDSENRIHGEDARRYGFRGGLVPGVAIYAYATRPVVEAFGRAWLESGAFSIRLLKPVYDGETLAIVARVAAGGVGDRGQAIEVSVLDENETLRATARASIPTVPPGIRRSDYPDLPPPAPEERPPASLASLPVGKELGRRELVLDLDLAERTFVRDMLDPLPAWRGPNALLHPAFLPAQANYILRDNVALGPWIHAGSEVRHLRAATRGDRLVLTGRVAESFAKRGKEFVRLDLGAFDGDGRPLARILHTAIVRLDARQEG